MAYINSSYIDVFPSTKRNSQRSARLLTEANLISIINQIVDKDAFVITQEYTGSGTDSFEFNIHGYYFKVTPQNAIATLGTNNVWAKITLSVTTPPTPQGDTFVELDGQDDGTYYEGVVFSDSEPVLSTNEYSLQLLTKVNNSWTIPDSSKVRFAHPQNILGDLIVDGGIIA